MKMKLRYIYGIMGILCIDFFICINFLFPNKISSDWMYYFILPIIIIDEILNIKFGYLLDKHEKEFYILGAIIGFVSILLFIFYGISKQKNFIL